MSVSLVCRKNRGDAAADFLNVCARIERGNAEPAFASRAESRSGSDDDLGIVQHQIEHFPRCLALWAAYPDVGSIFTTKYGQAGLLAGIAKEGRVAHVVFDQFSHLHFSFVAKKSGRSFLHRVAGAVELGAVTA